MRKEVDGRGQLCPKPVIMTKKQLDEIDEGIVTAIVDNKTAKINISKLASSLGCEYKVNKKSDEEYYIEIRKGKSMDGPMEEKYEIKEKKSKFKDMTIVFNSNTMGEGSDGLGRILMNSLMYTITETPPLPSTLIFYNGGVHLTCEGSEVLEDLRTLEEEGVEIISCGTCLDYLGLEDKLEVGDVSNMYTIYEKLKDPIKTVTIG